MKAKQLTQFLRYLQIIWIFSLLFLIVPENTYSGGQDSLITSVIQGINLSVEEVRKIESQLALDSNNINLHTQMLGYYFLRAFDSEQTLGAREKHILWVIKNHPEEKIAGTPFVELNPNIDGRIYEEAKMLWIEQTQKNPRSAAVWGNAANFFLHVDKEMAEGALIMAQKLEPDNPEWSRRLGNLYYIEMRNHPRQEKAEAVVKEISIDSLKKPGTSMMDSIAQEMHFYNLADYAKSAFEDGELKMAEMYARELLDKAPQYKDNWNYGNALHQGNIILGRIALKSGNANEAISYLIEAGKTPGSPQLNSFGPSMSLAEELLQQGEKEVVVQYLEECKNFWQMGKDQLEDWITIIKSGGVPDFGSNIYY